MARSTWTALVNLNIPTDPVQLVVVPLAGTALTLTLWGVPVADAAAAQACCYRMSAMTGPVERHGAGKKTLCRS